MATYIIPSATRPILDYTPIGNPYIDIQPPPARPSKSSLSRLLNSPEPPSRQPFYPTAGPSRLPTHPIPPYPRQNNMAIQASSVPHLSFGPFGGSSISSGTRDVTSGSHINSRARRMESAPDMGTVAKRARRSMSGESSGPSRRAVDHQGFPPIGSSYILTRSTGIPTISSAQRHSLTLPRSARRTYSSQIVRPSISPKSKSSTIITPGKDAFELRYTPEQLFVMLKGVEFEGTLPSVGLEGPGRERFDGGEDVKGRAKGSRRAVGKLLKQDIWTDEAEFVFLAAELYIPPSSASKIMFLNKPCGRNEIIGLVVTMALGKLMTRKQVSSHLQVVRQRKKMDPQLKLIFDQDDFAGAVTQGSPHLRGINTRLNEIMGLDRSCDLSTIPKPAWIVTMERKHPGPEYRNYLPSASVSDESTAGDHTVTSGGSGERPRDIVTRTPSGMQMGRGQAGRPNPAQAWLQQQSSERESDGESGSESESEGEGTDSSSGESSAIYPETSSSAGVAVIPDVRIVGPGGGQGWNMAGSTSPPFAYALPVSSIRPLSISKEPEKARISGNVCDLEALSIVLGSRTASIRAKDAGSIKSEDVPTGSMRFGDELLSTRSEIKLYHIKITVDPALLAEAVVQTDIGCSFRPATQGLSTNAPPIITAFSGYLEAYNGYSDMALPVRAHETETKVGGLPWMLQSMTRATGTEEVLPALLRDQIEYETAIHGHGGVRRAVEAILPYYWTVTVVSSSAQEERRSLAEKDCVLLYTYVAGPVGTFSVELDKVTSCW